jgi:hypothetical protein
MRRHATLILAICALPLTAGARPVIDNEGYAHISAKLLGANASDKGKQLEIESYSWGTGSRSGGHSMLGASDKLAVGSARTEGPGTLTIRGDLPGCVAGKRYAGMQFAASGKRYELQDVMIDGCTKGGATLNYRKVTVRGWDPEKKEL